jgi:hypothetical protein
VGSNYKQLHSISARAHNLQGFGKALQTSLPSLQKGGLSLAVKVLFTY